MKKYLGFYLFLLSFHSYGANTSAMLVLRAIVPEVTTVEVTMEKNGPKAILHTNHKGKHHPIPKFLIKKHATHYLVSVTHP